MMVSETVTKAVNAPLNGISVVAARCGWSKDDAKWAWTIFAAAIAALATLGASDPASPTSLAYYGIPMGWAPAIRGIAALVAIIGASQRRSVLPSAQAQAEAKCGAGTGDGGPTTAVCTAPVDASKSGAIPIQPSPGTGDGK